LSSEAKMDREEVKMKASEIKIVELCRKVGDMEVVNIIESNALCGVDQRNEGDYDGNIVASLDAYFQNVIDTVREQRLRFRFETAWPLYRAIARQEAMARKVKLGGHYK
jgi:hypothetical protein